MPKNARPSTPGARFLPVGAGAGALAGGGMYVSFFNAATGDVTVVVWSPSDAAPEAATFALTGPGAAGVAALHAVRSRVVADGHPQPDMSAYFVAQPDVPVAPGGAFALSLAPGDLWTLTTVAGLRKGAPPTPPPAAPFPPAFADNFDACAPESEAAYWTDMTGSWQCVAAPPPNGGGGGGGGGMAMRQAVPAHPIAWRPEEQRPFSVFAGDISWAAAALTIDVRMAAGEGALVGVRANPNCCGRVITGEDLMPGLWLGVQAGHANYTVWNAIQNATTAAGVVHAGALARAPAADEWVTLTLEVTAQGVASAAVGGATVFAGLDVRGLVPDTGFPGIGTFAWGQYVYFDNLNVSGSSAAAA